MDIDLSIEGSASAELADLTHRLWIAAAESCGIDLSGFDPKAPLSKRLAFAASRGLTVATVLTRFSSKMQHSTESQVGDCVEWAARNRLYTPPEYLNVDEAISGMKDRRAGLNRLRSILKQRLAPVMLVFKASRLFRLAHRSFRFISEEIIEEGLRAVSVSEGIDTSDGKGWKMLAAFHGVMDEMLLETIADHARSGLKSIFKQQYVTGALTVGYERAEVPGARPTKFGKPRTKPAVNQQEKERIQRAFRSVRDGMPIRRAWKEWVKNGGGFDPRSTLKRMTYSAFRRMLSNYRYIGRWAFGIKRNQFSSKRDYTRQIPGPALEIVILQLEELRIVDDELFFAVQQKLEKYKTGERSGPKRRKVLHLWDLIAEYFFCAKCKMRFHQAGANGHGMRCKQYDICPCATIVRRKEALEFVCEKLDQLLQADVQLTTLTTSYAISLSGEGDVDLKAELVAKDRRINVLTVAIKELLLMAGEGTDEDRAETQGSISAARIERADLQSDCARLRAAQERNDAPMTEAQAKEQLSNILRLLDEAVQGKLGEEQVYQAAALFGKLVGGKIWVHVHPRPGRKRTNVSGTFTPNLLSCLCSSAQLQRGDAMDEVEVWLRKRPVRDDLADLVHELLDVQGKSYRDAAKILHGKGHNINSGVVWQIRRRYYEMRDLPVPDRPYNNGRKRKSRQPQK